MFTDQRGAADAHLASWERGLACGSTQNIQGLSACEFEGLPPSSFFICVGVFEKCISDGMSHVLVHKMSLSIEQTG